MQMDYEKVQKKSPQGNGGGGLSPVKLRSMLKKKKKQVEDELESSTFSLRSQVSQADETDCSSGNYKDVDVVSVFPESPQMEIDHKSKNQSSYNSIIKSQDDGSSEYENVIENVNVSSSPFEFQKAERAPHRKPTAPFSKPAPSKWDDAQKWIASPTSSRQKNEKSSRKNSYFSHGIRQPAAKVVVEVPDQRLVPYEEPDTKQIDSYSNSVLMIEDCVADSAINLSCHDSSLSIQSATTYLPPPSTAMSVSMRDMGTEMTPIASQEPSRTGTPVRATTPNRSPRSSSPNVRLGSNQRLSEKELKIETRREIKALGTQLGKMNIAAWASKEEDAMKNGVVDEQANSVIEIRATAWEEAEKAKYMARFKREEIKIEAWENHQKAKTEAEMRKTEVEVERMRGGTHDKLMKKLAAARHKAEEKRASAEAKRRRQVAKAEEQAEYIRKTGRTPSSFSCCF